MFKKLLIALSIFSMVATSPALAEQKVLGTYKITKDANCLGDLTVNGRLNPLGGFKAQSVTSSALEQGLIQFAQINLTSAQIIGMNASPVQLLAAPGAGKSILVHRVLFRMTTTSTAFTSGGATVVQYAGGTAATATIASSVVTAGAGTSDTLRNSIDCTPAQNAALQITNGTGAFASGTGSAVVYLYYSIR